MRSQVKKLITHLHRKDNGFTLVELLVVVAIVVALAAVIIPNVAQFTGKGTEGAYFAEAENVQTAFDTLMANGGVATIDARAAPSVAVADFATLPLSGGVAIQVSGVDVYLTDYLRGNPTNNFYCWDATGLIGLAIRRRHVR